MCGWWWELCPSFACSPTQVGVAVTFNYFVILLGFTSYLIIDSVRIEHNFLDVLCCVPAWWRRKAKSHTYYSSTPRGTWEVETAGAMEVPAEKNNEKEEIPSGSDQITVMVCLKRVRHYLSGHSVLTRLVERAYSPLLQNYLVKFVVIIFFACVLLPLAVIGCARVKDGLNLLEVVPQGTPEYGFVSASLQYFSYFDTYVVTGEMNYPYRQVELLQLHEEMLGLEHIVKDNDTGGSPFWLKAMIEYYEELYHKACAKEGIIDIATRGLNAKLQSLVNRNTADCKSMVVNETRKEGGVNRTYRVILHSHFYELLTVWVSASPTLTRWLFSPIVLCFV